MKATTRILQNLSTAALASLTLGGCYYGDVYGASSYATYDCAARYGDEYWSNDPYAYDDATYGYDCYDAADYHSGFVQIGFGGGWYDSYYYPGYGLFLYDRYGRRHGMSHNYLTYWGGRRAWWKHHGHRDKDHHRRPGHDRADGPRHDRPEGWRPGRGRGAGTVPPPDAQVGRSDGGWTAGDGSERPQGRPRGDGYDGRPRRDGSRWSPPAAGGGAPAAAAPRMPRPDMPARSNDNAGSAPAPRAAPPPQSAPAPRAAPPPPPAPVARPAPPPPRDGGAGRVRED